MSDWTKPGLSIKERARLVCDELGRDEMALITSALHAAATEARLDERKECARLCDVTEANDDKDDWREAARCCAELIRNRGKGDEMEKHTTSEPRTQAHPWFVWESEYPEEGCTIISAATAAEAKDEYRRMSGADPETELDAKPVKAEDVVRLETQWEQAKEEIGRLRAQVDIAKAELADVLVEADVERTKAETREQKLKDRIVALEAQLTTRGACECGADDVCALVRRAQEAEARAAALTRVVEIAEIALRHGALPDGETNVVEWARRKLADALIAGGDPRPSLAAPAPAAAATPTTPAPEQAGEGKRCPHTAPDENEQPTDDPCPFGRPCPFHDAREVRRG